MTDGLNAVWSNDRAAHTDTNPKNLELAPPQSITATRLDQLVYSPCYDTNIPGTIMKFIANYIKGRKAYTTYRNHASTQGGVLSSMLFNIYTADLPPPRAGHVLRRWHHHHIYTHTSTSAVKIYIQPYIHKVFSWTKHNNLTLNPDKTTCTLFTPDPAEYKRNLNLKINNTTLPMATHPNLLGLTLDPKLTYSTHIHNISVHAHKPLQIIKALTATAWGKHKETLMTTYKEFMRPALDYATSIWSPLACSTIINKLQVMYNWTLRTDTWCTQDTYNTCMTKHPYFPYTSTCSCTPHNSNKKHNIHHIPYTHIQHTSLLQDKKHYL